MEGPVFDAVMVCCGFVVVESDFGVSTLLCNILTCSQPWRQGTILLMTRRQGTSAARGRQSSHRDRPKVSLETGLDALILQHPTTTAAGIFGGT